MRCPFLQEMWVKSCSLSPRRKFIPRAGAAAAAERCSSPAYVDCALRRDHGVREAGGDACAFLRASLVQYCEQAPAPLLIPSNDGLLSHCNHEGHRHCRAYREATRGSRAPSGARGGGEAVDGLSVPAHLGYAENHLWLDLDEASGACFIGADALLVDLLGPIESVYFRTPRGDAHPTAVLTVSGTDLALSFPNPIELADVNARLRAYPERLSADPYGDGWLFEAYVPAGAAGEERAALCRGLRRGEEARAWMRREIDRASRFVHERGTRAEAGGAALAADGGSYAPGAAARLRREDRLDLFRGFFRGGRGEDR